MKAKIHVAHAPEQLHAAYRLRYETYIEEMRLFGLKADHEERIIMDVLDEPSRLFCAEVNGEVVGTLRLNCAADQNFDAGTAQAFGLNRFKAVLPEEKLAILSRFTILAGHRDGKLAADMIIAAVQEAAAAGVELIMCDCQPHLIHLYHAMGFRSFSPERVNDPSLGLMSPLALVMGDLVYLQEIDSPLLPVLANATLESNRARMLGQLLTQNEAAVELGAGEFDFLHELETNDPLYPLAPDDVVFLKGLSDEQIDRVLCDGVVVACAPGELLIEQGELNNTLYILLSGSLSIRIRGEEIAKCVPGDIVGEIAFLLTGQRAASVIAGPDGACVLGLNGQKLNQSLEANQSVASTVLQNLSLCLASRITDLMTSDTAIDKTIFPPKLPQTLTGKPPVQPRA